MNTHPMKKVTIVCEAYAKDAVTRLLTELGTTGYTLFPVEGDGSQGKRPADIPEYANIQIEILLHPDAADRLLETLGRDLFPRYAMVAYESEVRVLRPGKFQSR